MTRFAARLWVFVFWSVLLTMARANHFALRVNDVSGLDEPWPLIGGLPFPEGALHDAAQIRIVEAGGAEVPTQIDVLSTWHDGSIRWAQAGMTASPQGEYRVEFGPGISRRTPSHPLRIEHDSTGRLTVDTGAAVYEFLPERLLPETARMDGTVFLANAGDGAYLIDNHGRLARVAGERAEIKTEIVKQGPVRMVIRREGWYVTDAGEPIARARVWFYLSAGSPHLRVTHSLVLTEDTNTLWVRDYGLEFASPQPPHEAVFAQSEATEADRFIGVRASEDKRPMMAEMFSAGLAEREQTLFAVAPDGEEVYMLQENYPHVLERAFRAVVARAASPRSADGAGMALGNLWVHNWLKEFEVAGDWAEARFEEHALMVVMPQLAQRFPKEIAVGPTGARVAFWSGRSGRELDFRSVTLVNEYWKRWADNAIHAFGMSHRERGPAVGTRVASQPSNAQGAARTHDVWVLPRRVAMDASRLRARGIAAAHPPLLQADPAWLGASAAVGWPMHPKDTERFPEVEAAMSDYWTETLGGRFGNVELRRTGFIMWGKHVTLGTGPRWFRLSHGAGHYGLDRSAWMLYMRSGERRYYDYARHFTRFAGDLKIHHWTGGGKFRGGFARTEVHQPFYWGQSSQLGGGFWTLGWMLDYYLTGDEYANELLQMRADAYREHADANLGTSGYLHAHVYNLSILYQHTRDETIKELARKAAHTLIDLDNPTGLNDRLRYGVYYKISTEWLFPLYLYYHATGDAIAREVVLRALDDKFRFNHEDWTHTPGGRGPSSDQTFRLLLFAAGYHLTGNPAYQRLVNHMIRYPHSALMGHNLFHGMPAALQVIASAEAPIEPFPVLALTRAPNHKLVMDHEFIEADALPPVRFRKAAGEPVTLSIYVRMSNDMDENAEPDVVVRHPAPDGVGDARAAVQIEKAQSFNTKNPGRRDLRRWHSHVTLPADLPEGDYTIAFPGAATITVLESNVPLSR